MDKDTEHSNNTPATCPECGKPMQEGWVQLDELGEGHGRLRWSLTPPKRGMFDWKRLEESVELLVPGTGLRWGGIGARPTCRGSYCEDCDTVLLRLKSRPEW